ncbi:MAG TPA: tetratricopeptide repeat protein, partial [Thermoanaerobaculia bacterium]|nr:tetratricopeptide repeat protein [Thermoanaerobaculia bacterium]
MSIRTPSLAAAVVLTLASAAVARADSGAGGSPAGLFLEALDTADRGLYEQALEVLEEVARQVPDDAYVELERAEMLLHLGRVEEASRTVARARELAPASDDALRLQGRIELLRADRDGVAAATARDAFERLREHDPEDLEALVSLGQIYLAADQPGLAAEALAEASRLRPGHPGIESLLARALESGADPGRVEQVQRERLSRNPTALDTRLELVDLLGRQGRAEEALEVLEGASRAQAGSFDVRRRLALYLYLTGELDGALEAARGMVEEWPEYGGGRLLLARVETTFGRFEEAERTLAPLLSRPPLPEAVAEVHVRILEGSGRIEEAAAQLDDDRQRLLGEGRRA